MPESWMPPVVADGRGPNDRPPADLCPEQASAWMKWRNHYLKYSTLNPTEWPGGAHIMDSRTGHTERRRSWIIKDAEQMEMIERFCRGGRSPQCSPGCIHRPAQETPR